MSKRIGRFLAAAALAAALGAIAAAPASADFGLKNLDVTFTNADGSELTQAGAHPFAMTTNLDLNTVDDPISGAVPDGDLKDLQVAQIPGFAGNPTAVPRCSDADFFAPGGSECPRATAVGTNDVEVAGVLYTGILVYSLVPPPGVAAKIGFSVLETPVTVELGVSESPPYDVVARLANTLQVIPFAGSKLTVWGIPADPAHDAARGGSTSAAEVPFLTVPRACQGPLPTIFEADSWQGSSFEESIFTHDEAGEPRGFLGCAKLGFSPSIFAQPTSKAASSPTGLDFNLDVNDEGLTNPSYEAVADSDIEKAVVTLPEGMSANPSLAEGLNVCTREEFEEKETLVAAPGEGCPNASKIGTVEVETPLLEGELLKGALFIAKPYENEFNSLLALYIVIKSPTLGIIVKQAAKITPDPVTGQLVTTTEEMPQLPFSHFRLHFREGTRSPLVTPSACGAYPVKAELTPYSGNPPVESTSTFEVISGPNNGPCPTGGLPPFHPGLVAGTINNRAGSFSPFDVRLFRSDSEQEITHFSIKLPPGIVGKLAGVPFCSDAAIAAAKARTGPLGGHEELASPSCPAASQIGRTLAGAGVGPALAYATGKVYLSGPYHGSPLSLVAITAGVVGPFDIGTVVVREALRVNPENGEVFIDATGSDPIPHIVEGIPVHLRDIRVYVDRPEFVLNPTDCTQTSTASTLLGAGLDFVSEADDNPVTVTTRFQAADCAALRFAPQLKLRLVGGTKRGSHPAFRAHLDMTGIGEASIGYSQVTLPHSEFLENAHIKTICTRVQFNAGGGNGEQCPADSIYGHASATTPLLEGPLSGPVYLRSSEHQLPDLVAALHHAEINIDLVGHIDSVKGRIRNTFEVVPDAPVSTFDLELQGAGKGLLVNSTDLCKKKNRAIADFTGHNGKVFNTEPVLAAKCPKHHKGKAHHKRRHRAALRLLRAAR